MRTALKLETTAVVLLALNLAACTPEPARPAGSLDSYNNLVAPPGQKIVADPGCVVSSHRGILRPGDNIPTHYLVKNTGRWCFWGVGISGESSAGARLVDHPDHGTVRILQLGGGTALGYRPQPGYTGSDSFLVTLPTGYGYENNVAATVRVTP